MELVSRMMDGSVSYDSTDRFEPSVGGSGDRQEGEIDLDEIPILNGCSQRQLRSVAKIVRVLDAAAGTVFMRRGEPADEFFLILDGTVNVHVSEDKLVPFGTRNVLRRNEPVGWRHPLGHRRVGDADPPSCG